MNLIDKARIFALAAHGTQRYGAYPYAYHLQVVVDVLIRFNLTDEILLCAAWLHDTIEDTSYCHDDIKADFGEDIAVIVSALTNEDGDKKDTWLKLKTNRQAVAVKLADRIANVEECIKNNPTKLKCYIDQYHDFKTILFIPNEYRTMWQHLDALLGY